jgi:hypothetical protein
MLTYRSPIKQLIHLEIKMSRLRKWGFPDL